MAAVDYTTREREKKAIGKVGNYWTRTTNGTGSTYTGRDLGYVTFMVPVRVQLQSHSKAHTHTIVFMSSTKIKAVFIYDL